MDFPEIRERDRTPKYQVIADAIIRAIRSGELRPGDVIPSEKQLQGATRTSRKTARRAIAWLRDQGWIETVAGRGSYIKDKPPAT
jgi:GntR family transcriptional regulator